MNIDQKAKTLVFVPTYNDFDLLIDVTTQIASLSPSFSALVLDDGSSRHFDSSLLPERCLYYRLPDNVGLGVCTHIAFDHALRHGYTWLARADADGQHPIERLPDMISAIVEKNADIAIGVRTNHRQPKLGGLAAAVVKSYFSFVGHLVTGGETPKDMNTGFFVLNQRAVSLLNRLPLDHYPEPLLFIRACRYGLKTVEVSVSQQERQYGQSSLNLLQALRLFYRFNITVLAELFQDRQER